MIEVTGLGIRQGGFALENISFSVPQASYGVLMGRSGCGKSTILEIICGLRKPAAGRVILAGRDVTGLRPGERGLGYVPQDRALFPTMRVRDQIAFPLVIRKWSPQRIAARVDELAEMMGVHHLLDRMPEKLSGGEAQRITLARALAAQPSVLCLDEPLSALDEEMHAELCELLGSVIHKAGVTVLHVTHSRREADQLGDQIFRLEKGKVALLT